MSRKRTMGEPARRTWAERPTGALKEREKKKSSINIASGRNYPRQKDQEPTCRELLSALTSERGPLLEAALGGGQTEKRNFLLVRAA